jgi:hypothetical protein
VDKEKREEKDMTTLTKKPKVNPLSRRPRQQRLVMAVRGAAGSGKSYFARSLADAGLGRVAIFDTERKARLLPGVNVQFDAFEIYESDELPDFIEWALTSDEAKEFNYGGFVLDSWAAYFSAKHSELLAAVRERTGDPLAQPSAEELAADQMIFQGVLRRLCTSGQSVVIVDQIAAKGKEEREANEVGQVLPITASGLEYFCDLVVEIALQERDGELMRVFQVVKSNSPAFELGYEMSAPVRFDGTEKAVTFRNFLAHLLQGADNALPVTATPPPSDVPETLPVEEVAFVDVPRITINDLITKAEANGFRQSDLVTAAKIYHNQPNIYRLTPAQVEDLDQRMTAKIEKLKAAEAAPAAVVAKTNGRASKAMAQ